MTLEHVKLQVLSIYIYIYIYIYLYKLIAKYVYWNLKATSILIKSTCYILKSKINPAQADRAFDFFLIKRRQKQFSVIYIIYWFYTLHIMNKHLISTLRKTSPIKFDPLSSCSVRINSVIFEHRTLFVVLYISRYWR